MSATGPAAPIAEAAARRSNRTGARSPAAELARLSATSLVDVTYSAATVTGLVAVGAAEDGPRVRAARGASDAAAGAFGQLAASIYGEDAGQRAAALGEEQRAGLARYARAKDRADDVAAATALRSLEAIRDRIGTLLDEVDPEGARGPFAAALGVHTDALTAVVRAQATSSPRTGRRLRAAAQAARAVGQALTERVARQFPERFPAS